LAVHFTHYNLPRDCGEQVY